MQTVTERLQKAHRLMVSKDELLTSLSTKLRATAEALRAKEVSENALRTEAGNARSEKEKLSYKLGALHTLRALQKLHALRLKKEKLSYKRCVHRVEAACQSRDELTTSKTICLRLHVTLWQISSRSGTRW